jgi:hypothetical protein
VSGNADSAALEALHLLGLHSVVGWALEAAAQIGHCAHPKHLNPRGLPDTRGGIRLPPCEPDPHLFFLKLWLTLDDSPNAPVTAEWPERLRAASQVQWATTSITMQIFMN